MRKTWLAAAAAALIGLTAAAQASEGVPGWLKLLHWISGDGDSTSIPVTMMRPHMQLSRRAPARPGDRARADAIVAAAREVLRRYPTSEAAARDGYKPFHQSGEPGEEVHFTSLRWAYAEGNQIDYRHPGSLLFRRGPRGLEPVGVM